MVDLPLPLVPTSAQLVPAGTVNEAPCTERLTPLIRHHPESTESTVNTDRLQTLHHGEYMQLQVHKAGAQ